MNGPFLVMLAVSTAITTTKGTIEIVYPLYLSSYGLSLSIIGLLTSLLAVAQLSSRVPVGVAYRAERARGQFALVLVAFALTCAAFAFANGDPLAVAVITFLHGFTFGSAGTLGLALAIDITEGRSAGVSMAWYTAAISLGYAVGSVVGGWLGETIGLGPSMGAIAVLPVIGALAVLALPRISGARPPDRGTGWRGLLRAGGRLDARVWLAVVTVVFINLIWDSLDTFFVIFAPTVGITLATVGLLRALKSGAGLAIRLGGALVLRFADYRRITLVAVLAVAATMVVLPLSSAIVVLVPLFIVLGFGRGVIRATSAATIAELRAEGRDVGLASGIYNAGLDIGSIVGPAFGGVLANAVGIPRMFQIIALMGLAIWLAVALSSARTRAAAGLGGSNVIPLAEPTEMRSERP